MKERNQELDQLIDMLLPVCKDSGTIAHRQTVKALCDCIEPLMRKRLHPTSYSLKCIATARRWADGEISSIEPYSYDPYSCHNSVVSLMELATVGSSLRHSIFCALTDGTDDESEYKKEVERMCETLRQVIAQSVREVA